jgi:hypothetical protein
MEMKGSAFHMVSSDVCIDPANDWVLIPSRVPSVCMYEVVKAFNTTVLVAKFNCSRSLMFDKQNRRVKVFSIVEKGRGYGQRVSGITAGKSPNFAAITCDAFYHMQEADVTWHGKGNACKIHRCTLTDAAPRPYINPSVQGNMSSLELALSNAFYDLVDPTLFEGDGSTFEDFYGVIHAAGAPS